MNLKLWLVLGTIIALIFTVGGYVVYKNQTKSASILPCTDTSQCPPANVCTNGFCMPVTPFPRESSTSAQSEQ